MEREDPAEVAPKDRQETWGKWEAEVDLLADRLGEPVDEGIKETVTALNCLGFTTSQSCYGHADRENALPWVSIRSPELEALFEEVQPLFNLQRPHYERTGKPLEHPKIAEYIDKARAAQAGLASFVQKVLDDFTAETDHELIIDPNLVGSVRIIPPEGPDEQSPDLATAQLVMTEFGRFLRKRFMDRGAEPTEA